MSAAKQSGGSAAAPRTRRVPVAGFGRRLLATIYDGILLFFLTFLISFLIGFVAVFFSMFGDTDQPRLEGLIIVVGLIVSVLYYVWNWSASGQTVGKSLAGLRVVPKDGEKLSVGKALVRYIGYIISGLVLSLGFLWIAFDSKRQGWHDKMAGTFVVEKDSEPVPGTVSEFVPADPDAKPWIWVVLWLVVAVLAPWGLFGSLWVLGPFMARLIANWVQ
jgi:uncharacterized RDD family membrane protein YckC